jgi:phosphatidylserine decarboxylase
MASRWHSSSQCAGARRNNRLMAFWAGAFVGLQKLLPQRALSRLSGVLAGGRYGFATRAAVRAFIRAYAVDMSEAAQPDPARYASFNDFFTRALRPGARPLPADPRVVVCPADGRVSQIGAIAADTLIQAKGLNYGLLDLCDGDRALADRFLHGSFACIYLAPGDYHRVHMPAGGQASFLRYAPGALFAVNQVTAQVVPQLFCRNERVIAVFASHRHWLAMIMVGALNVGSIELTFPPGRLACNRPHATLPPHATEALGGPLLARGDEFGRFNLGSTVIVLASHRLLEWDENVNAGDRVRMGQAIGRLGAAAS